MCLSWFRNNIKPRSRYSWTSAEIEEAERAVVLLAADVIYSDNLTDLFFGTLEKLMSHGSEKVVSQFDYY